MKARSNSEAADHFLQRQGTSDKASSEDSSGRDHQQSGALSRCRARAIDDPAFCRMIADLAEAAVEALQAGGKLVFAGNGGSAADAEHIAGKLVDRLNYDRAPIAAIALTTDTSVLTAIGNDYG